MQKGIVLLALHPFLVLGVASATGFLCRLFLYRPHLNGFLSLFDGSGEIAGGLWRRFIGLSLYGMDKQQAREIVVVLGFHIRKSLAEVCVAIVVDIIPGDKLLVLSGGGIILVGRARWQQRGQKTDRAKLRYNMP